MEKTAQKLRRRTKIREWWNKPKEALIGAVSPEFATLMDSLRNTDDGIREDAAELKNLIKLAKTNFNRREYMTALTFLGRFHAQLEAITNKLDALAAEVNIKHHQFLFGDMEPENIDYILKTLGPKFEKRKSVKKASLSDWWHNLTDERGKTMKAWEKRFPRETKELKRQLGKMIIRSESLFSNLVDTFKTLGSFRATRKLEEYLQTAAKFKQKYSAYDNAFADFYNSSVGKFVESQRKEMEEKAMGAQKQELPEAQVPSLIVPPATPEKNKAPEQEQKQIAVPDLLPKPISDKYMPKGKAMPVALKLRDPKDLTPEQKAYVEKEKMAQLPFESTRLSPGPLTNVDIKPPVSHEFGRELEEIQEEPTDIITQISPRAEMQLKEKPIKVEMANLHNEFIEKLSELKNESQFAVATQLIMYANKIKESDPKNSAKLIELSNKLLG